MTKNSKKTTHKRTILVICNDIKNVNLFRIDLIQDLSNKYEVIILANFNDQIRKINNCKYVNIPIKSNSYSLVNLFKSLLIFIKAITNFKPNLVYAFTIKPILLSLIISRFIKCKYILTFTGLGNFFLRHKKIYKILFKNFFNLIVKNNKKFKVYFHNKDDKDLFSINANNYHVINGSGIKIDNKKNKYFNKKRKILIVVVTRFIKEKGIYDIIDLIYYNKSYLKKFYDFKIYGGKIIDLEYEYQKKFKFLLKEKYFKFYGFSPNLFFDLNRNDILLHLSKREGCSNVILEALQSNVMPIAYDVPGCRNLIKPKYGILKNDLAEIKELFLNFEFLKHKIIQFKKISKINLLKNFSKKHINKIYLDDAKFF